LFITHNCRADAAVMQMNGFITPLTPALPEIFLLTMTCLTLVIDVYVPDRYRHFSFQMTQGILVATSILCVVLYPENPVYTFSNTFVSDGMSSVLKASIALISCFAFFYAKIYLETRDQLRGEYFILGLFAVLGMMVLVSAASLLTVYLGLELLSLCLYAMVALHRDSISASEAAMKYFVLGALASGMLLYGISLVYGITGSLEISAISGYLMQSADHNLIATLGLVFIIVGIAFKLGAVPFHMWVPDVYQGAPAPVALFIGSAPKMAAFGMLIRLLVDGLHELQAQWTDILILLAVLSIATGNLIAIAQSSIKRMLGYSTVAHVGFLFLGVIAGNASGYGAAMFYILTYALMAAGGFGMIIYLSHKGLDADHLDEFKGLGERNVWFAFLMLILMFSMAGVPPFVGFWAKWSVLREVVAADHAWLAAVAVFFSIIGLYYYLRVVRLMFFDKPENKIPVSAEIGMKIAVSTNALLVLGLGIFPGALLAVCIAAFSA